MRSRTDYTLTKDEVHGSANHWPATGLKPAYEGRACTGSTVIQILLIAAARAVSVFAVCCDPADTPRDQTIRKVLEETLPTMVELERRLNRTLATDLPVVLRRKSRMIAVDLTLIPYHGRPHEDEKEIYRGSSKSGTTHFHA